MEIIETEEVKEDEEKGRCLFTFSQKVSIYFCFFFVEKLLPEFLENR